MNRSSDPISWMKAIAYLTVVGVFLSLVFEKAPQLPWLALGAVLFALLLPIWWGAAGLAPGVIFGFAVADAFLVLAGQFASGNPGTVMILYFVLLPVVSRLPRRFSFFCYVGFPLMACLPWLLGDQGLVSWEGVTSIAPGFLAIIAFSEGYWTLRKTGEENQKLIEELVCTQKLLHPEEVTPPTDPIPFTRREKEVLGLVAKGFSNKEIAQRLYLAEGTVKNRVSDILEKTGVRDRTQAALRARELGIL